MKTALQLAEFNFTRRKSIWLLLTLPLLLAFISCLLGIIRANDSLQTFPLAKESIQNAVNDGRLTAEQGQERFDALQQNEDEHREQYAALTAPRSIQVLSQFMVTGGALFALLLGITVAGTSFSTGFMRTAVTVTARRRRLLLLHLGGGIIIWSGAVIAVVVLGLLAGFLASSLLTVAGPPSALPITDIALAVLGIFLTGVMWIAIGTSLVVLSKSTVPAVIMGFCLLIGENFLGLANDSFQQWLPTYGAVTLVSSGAPKLYNGLALATTAFPNDPPTVPVALILLTAITLVATQFGLWRFSRADLE